MELTGRNLACERGGRQVFAALNFTVAAGHALILRGPNGAGKTSLLRMIAGLIEPAEGEFVLQGGHQDLEPGQQAHLVAHQEALKPALTVEENLQFWAGFLGGGDIERALEALNLTALAGFSAGLLSAGQKRRLALARLALVPRAIWLLDEPSVGLDAASQVKLQALVHTHLEKGGIVVAATHTELGIRDAATLDFSELAA